MTIESSGPPATLDRLMSLAVVCATCSTVQRSEPSLAARTVTKPRSTLSSEKLQPVAPAATTSPFELIATPNPQSGLGVPSEIAHRVAPTLAATAGGCPGGSLPTFDSVVQPAATRTSRALRIPLTAPNPAVSSRILTERGTPR